jgi:hypothetical protein
MKRLYSFSAERIIRMSNADFQEYVAMTAKK